MNELIFEGLRPLDLNDLVYPFFEVDSYRSKMGDDNDVCVVNFHVKERSAANDLMEFIEKGYSFVLDADVSSGENSRGEYHVFVELDRTPRLYKQIDEMLYGVKRLTGVDLWKFKYYKDKDTHEVNEDTLKKYIPSSPSLYEGRVRQYQTESFRDFFNKTLMDDLTFDGTAITIHKPYDKKYSFKVIKEGDRSQILENNSDSLTLDNNAMGEIFWLTKVVGDYNINKLGDYFIFENGDKAMLLQRIEQ
jgi:hypothetical protein